MMEYSVGITCLLSLRRHANLMEDMVPKHVWDDPQCVAPSEQHPCLFQDTKGYEQTWAVYPQEIRLEVQGFLIVKSDWLNGRDQI